ncbi:MAG: hypothetical protein ABW033_08445 [Acidimicrobiia bacterium]
MEPSPLEPAQLQPAQLQPAQLQPEPSVAGQSSGRPSHLRLGEILIRHGHIDQDDLALALSQQDLDDHDMPLGKLLVTLGAISDETLTQALSEQSGLPIVDLEGFTPDADVVGRVSKEVALQLEMLPMELRDGAIVVALAEPPSRDLRREIGRRLRARAQIVLATPVGLQHAIERAFPAEPTPLDLIPSTGVRYERPAPGDVMRIVARDADVPAVLAPGPDAPDRILEWLVGAAVESGARSLHVLSQPGGVLVRARVDQDMCDLVQLPEPAGSMLVARLLRSFGLAAGAGEAQRGTSSSGRQGFGPLLALDAAPTAHGLSVLVRPLGPESVSDQEPAGLDVVRRHLAHVMARGRGLAVLLCRDRELRRTILCRLATDPMMRARNVATVDVRCEVAAPRTSQLSSPQPGGQSHAIRSARDLDHDVVLVDIEFGDTESLCAAVDVGMEAATVIAGIGADVPRAIADLCGAAPPPLLASALAVVIRIDPTGATSVVTASDEMRERLLDGDGAQDLIEAVEAGVSVDDRA